MTLRCKQYALSHCREGGNPVKQRFIHGESKFMEAREPFNQFDESFDKFTASVFNWIPACAGMTSLFSGRLVVTDVTGAFVMEER
ncbi:MAG TPA: hypothetical protein VG962_13195 [Steroidobacteraceae bacterium]|nr:hypothetical protein [Steroidobacteraceae bacterium]